MSGDLLDVNILLALAQTQGLTLLTFDRKIEAFCPFSNVVKVLQLDI